MGKKHYNINYNPISLLKLGNHIEFVACKSERSALTLLDKYKDALKVIKSTPEICPKYFSDISSNAEFRYKLFGNRYRIVFEILPNIIYVHDIQDCRQDTNKNLI